jgi:hypothetical protein
MRVVLYADDMEPITVIELAPFLHEMLKERRRVRVAAPMPVSYATLTGGPTMADAMMHIVEIRAEVLMRKGREHMMLFTDDEVTALMLRSELLPGQRRDAQERDREQYAKGFLLGLTTALGG